MWKRPFWQRLIKDSLSKKPILWLSGVRRSGKTTLCQSLEDVHYYNCELPSVRRRMEDSESFLADQKKKIIVLDEIHRLENPSELLKIAADHFPRLRVVATGSSTLEASKRFKDTLAGRKRSVFLTPMIAEDSTSFKNSDLDHRLLHGGLPPHFLSSGSIERDAQEWLDAFWSKDIQTLFQVERRHSFIKFFELLMTQSGGIFEALSFSKPCEISRTTVANYLQVLAETFIVHIVRPFSSNSNSEIISAPKVYAFDTGFVSIFRGYDSLNNTERGLLFEHLVINELVAITQSRESYYWRDKQGHEIDFVVPKRNKDVDVFETKLTDKEFDPKNLQIFRKRYAKGTNYVVVSRLSESYSKKYGDHKVRFVRLADLHSVF
jgi:predicted AAA+ superfamily ATPase